jgi:hypothetical protein
VANGSRGVHVGLMLEQERDRLGVAGRRSVKQRWNASKWDRIAAGSARLEEILEAAEVS